MKKLILILVAICSAAVMQAQEEYAFNVPYIDADGTEKICPKAKVVKSSDQLVPWYNGWYVVNATTDMTISGGVICSDAVHLILADGCYLTTTSVEDYAGIQVQNEGNSSLSIYGQKNQSGTLIASGGIYGAGIGGGDYGSGSNITINGGTVIATGGSDGGAGIGGGRSGSGSNITINGGRVTATGGIDGGAGIGGGNSGSGSNITINGGTVTATGKSGGAGIGGGKNENGSNIYATNMMNVVADGSIILHASSVDIANELAGKKTISAFDVAPFIKAIDDAVGSSEDATILEIANTEKTSILKQTTVDGAKSASDLAVAKINAVKELLSLIGDDPNLQNMEFMPDIIENIASATDNNDINTKKSQAEYAINGFLNGFSSGKEAGKADAFGTLGTPQNGPAIEVIDQNDNVLKLYNPKKVKFIKEGE